jgi:hypothetical protein
MVFYLVFYQLGYQMCSRRMFGLNLLQMLAIQARCRVHSDIQPHSEDVRPGVEYYMSSLGILPDIELGIGSTISPAIGRKTISTSHKNQLG